MAQLVGHTVGSTFTTAAAVAQIPASTVFGRMAQLVEHIVHIDGVTGSSPVATTNVESP